MLNNIGSGIRAGAGPADATRGLKTDFCYSQSFSREMRQHAFNDSQQLRMGQTTRSQGIYADYSIMRRP
jgi:hypothetical protein